MSDPRSSAETVRAALAGDEAAVRALVDELSPVAQIRAARAVLARQAAGGGGGDVRAQVEDLTRQVFTGLFADSARALKAWDPARRVPLAKHVGFFADYEVASILTRGQRAPWTDEPIVEGDRPSPDRAVAADAPDTLASLLARVRARFAPRGLHLFELLAVEERPAESACAEAGLKADVVPAWKSRVAQLARELAPSPPPQPVADAAGDDALFALLGRAAREESGRAAGDPRWEKLAFRELSTSDEAALADGELRYEAFRPLSEDARARAVAEASVTPRRPMAGWQWALLIVVPIAIAFVLNQSNESRSERMNGPVAPYALMTKQGEEPEAPLGNPPSDVTLAHDGRVVFALEPSANVEGEVSVRAFALAPQGGEAQSLPIAETRSAAGRIQVTVSAKDFPAPGRWPLILAVGRPGELPTDPGVITMIAGGYDVKLSWQLFRVNVTVPTT